LRKSKPLIIYAGFRIWKLIPQRVFKILFIFFYSFLVLALPIAELLSHASAMDWADFIMVAGYFSLPLLWAVGLDQGKYASL
jgi:hypothetical protein